MTPEDQNIAIAKACGWLVCEVCDTQGIRKLPIPDYCNDLNAMHEAEATLQHYGHFVDKLAEVLGVTRQSISLPGATAAQRAEAFLKTLDLWEEQPS